MSESLPCPSCGVETRGQSPCPACGVAFSPRVRPRPPEPVQADFTRVLIVLGVAAGLLIGAAVGWRLAPRTAPAEVAEREEPAAVVAPERDPLHDPIPDPWPVEPAEEEVAPGMTAAELLQQPDEPLSDLVPVQPPALDVSVPTDAPGLVTKREETRPGWYEDAEGYARARSEWADRPVPLVVYFHTDWCSFCRRLDDDFLAQDDVSTWMNRALRVAINPEHGDAELALAREFGIRGYPGLFVFAPGAETPRRVHPFRRGHTIKASQFLSELRDAAGER